MNQTIAWRVFVAVVVTCLLAFAVAAGTALDMLGDSGAKSADNGRVVSATVKSGHPQLDPDGSAQQQVAAAASDIATASADLSQVAADVEAANP